jgi:predicted Zn finger-like uncharacterized protein
MIEIVCPSCGARYQVPDESIGPGGRNVTCSSCSHKWRAYREVPGETVGAAEPHSGAAEEAAAAPPPSGGREEQMDTIRRMLEELKRTEASGPDPEAASAAARPSRPEQAARRRDEEELLDEDLDADPLKARITRLTREGRPGKEAARMANYDAAKLRKKHERRARQLQRAKERRRRSGAFVTGFTLVAAVAATMASLYVLHPQIVASSPEMGPAMNQYVVTVDRYRLALDEATAGWQEWIAQQMARFGGGGEEGGPAPAQN